MTYLLSFLGIAVFWLACGFVAAGLAAGIWDADPENRRSAALLAFWLGPFALLIYAIVNWRKWW